MLNVVPFAGGDDAPGGRSQFLCRNVPAGDELKHFGHGLDSVGKDASQKFAEDERVHNGGFVFGFNGRQHGFGADVHSIDGF